MTKTASKKSIFKKVNYTIMLGGKKQSLRKCIKYLVVEDWGGVANVSAKPFPGEHNRLAKLAS